MKKSTGQKKIIFTSEIIKIIMEDSNENLYVKIFCVIGIIAFAIMILWFGYKFYPVIKRIIFGTQNSFIGTREVENYSRNSLRDEALIEKCIETRVNLRKNQSVHRWSSDTGFLMQIKLGTRHITFGLRLFSKSRF